MAEKIQAIRVHLTEALNDREKPWKAPLDLVEQKTGVPRQYVVLGEYNKKVHLHTFSPFFNVRFLTIAKK